MEQCILSFLTMHTKSLVSMIYAKKILHVLVSLDNICVVLFWWLDQ